MSYEFDNKLSYIRGLAGTLKDNPEKAYQKYLQHIHEIRLMAERVGNEYELFSQRQTFEIQGTPYLEAILSIAYVRKEVVVWLRHENRLLASINTEANKHEYPLIDDFIDEINRCADLYSHSIDDDAEMGAIQAKEMADVFMILKKQFG